MESGRIVFRNPESDKHVNLKPISSELVDMIMRKEIKAMDVVNAISAKIKENGDFNLQQYIDDMKKLNVRRSNPQGAPVHEELPDRKDEEVSLAEVKAVSKADATPKKERIKKVNSILDAAPETSNGVNI